MYLIQWFSKHFCKGKSLSKALIFASTNPQYEDILFFELQVQYMKIPSSTWGEHVVYRNCFWQRFTCNSKSLTTYLMLNNKNIFFQVYTGKSLSEALLFGEHGEKMLCTEIILNVINNFCTQHVLPRFELGIFMYWHCNSMNNLSSYCGLVDAKVRASDKDLPVPSLHSVEITTEVSDTSAIISSISQT